MRKKTQRGGFTLLEVMIAVMILSVVIMALLQMYANGAHIFKTLGAKREINQYISLLSANKKYGLESDSFYLDALVDDFEISNNLRAELKNIKMEVVFEKTKNRRTVQEEKTNLDTGRVILKVENLQNRDAFKTSFLRLRINE